MPKNKWYSNINTQFHSRLSYIINLAIVFPAHIEVTHYIQNFFIDNVPNILYLKSDLLTLVLIFSAYKI